jgi:predicted nucleic acid-binding protein
MILYLDASALVKRYIAERESEQVSAWIGSAELAVTAIISRVEVAAAIARAGRMKMIDAGEADAALRAFRSEWESFSRIPIGENTVSRGDILAVEHNLRAYDATHLACSLIWQESLGLPVTLATFDRELWVAAREIKIRCLPEVV